MLEENVKLWLVYLDMQEAEKWGMWKEARCGAMGMDQEGRLRGTQGAKRRSGKAKKERDWG